MHEPEGDRNPYDPVPWSRHPLEPFADETFEVGVRTSTRFDTVVVEWHTDHQDGRSLLVKSDDVWSGRLGPFVGDCRYRFVATGSSVEEAASEWFFVPIAQWEPITFSDISSDSHVIQVGSRSGRLTLTPHGEDTITWALEERSSRRGAANPVTVGGWRARLDSGRVVLSRDDHRFVLWADAARIDGRNTAWRLNWQLDPDERLFGTGERFDTFDQRGKAPDIRVFEQYRQQGERTYFPLPWLMSTRGYGLAIDGARRVRFDLGATSSEHASVMIPSPAGASGRWYLGPPKAIIEAYVTDIGLPSAMPVWAYGPWMSGNEWDSDRRIRDVVDKTHAVGVPATVVVIEAWSDETTFYLFNDTTYDPVEGTEAVPVESMQHGGKWPDPKGLVDWLHERGIRVLLWQIPVLKDVDDHPQHDADVRHAEDAGLCVHTIDGGTYRNRGWWFPNSRVIDFTNADARRWWFEKRAYLLDDIGIDGFKTDGGEHLWGKDVSAFDGTIGDEAANTYPTHYLAAYHDFMRDHGTDQPLTFSRAGFTGSQSFPAHWAGDEGSTWDAYRASLIAGLSAGASGIAFWGWDLAGFSGDLPSGELYKRAAAMAAFCPIMQYHSEFNHHRRPLADRTPWNVAELAGDSDVTSVYRFYARLRMNLIPYLLGLGAEASRTGIPLMRPLVLEYPDDPQAVQIDDQFLLGADVVVAPVLSPGVEERSVYLPEGDWRDLWTGEPVRAGWITALAPVSTIPVYVRGGACIPLWMAETLELGSVVGLPSVETGRLVLMVVPGSSRHTLIDPITLRPWTVQLALDGTTLTISTTNAPDGVAAWFRGATAPGRPRERLIPLPAGDAATSVELSDHEQ